MDYLRGKDARLYLSERHKVTLKEYEFYNLARSGSIKSTRDAAGHMLFLPEDLDAVAETLRNVQPAPPDLLGTTESRQYLQETHGLKLDRSAFRIAREALEEQGKIHVTRTAHPKRPILLFSRRDLDTMAVYTEEAKTEVNPHQQRGWLTVRETAAYLSQKFGRRIGTDIVYGRIRRKQLEPVHVDQTNGNHQYFFTKSAVDQLVIGPARSSYNEEKERIPIVVIKNIGDIPKLQKELGSKLLTKSAVLEIFEQRTNRPYSEESLRQMRKRKTLQPVARFGKTLLYKKSDAMTVHLLPTAGRKPDQGNARRVVAI